MGNCSFGYTNMAVAQRHCIEENVRGFHGNQHWSARPSCRTFSAGHYWPLLLRFGSMAMAAPVLIGYSAFGYFCRWMRPWSILFASNDSHGILRCLGSSR